MLTHLLWTEKLKPIIPIRITNKLNVLRRRCRFTPNLIGYLSHTYLLVFEKKKLLNQHLSSLTSKNNERNTGFGCYTNMTLLALSVAVLSFSLVHGRPVNNNAETALRVSSSELHIINKLYRLYRSVGVTDILRTYIKHESAAVADFLFLKKLLVMIV